MTWTHVIGSDSDLRGQFFNADGTPRGGAFAVNSSLANTTHASVAALAGGATAVAWEQTAGGATQVQFAMFGAGGAPLKGTVAGQHEGFKAEKPADQTPCHGSNSPNRARRIRHPIKQDCNPNLMDESKSSPTSNGVFDERFLC